MKNIKYLILFLLAFLGFSCEKVVDVALDEAEPRLVIDAVIRWQKGTLGNEQLIKLSLTNDFYSSTVLPASGAVVTITNSTNEVFEFTQQGTTENYICTNFIPTINETYVLEVLYKNEVYTATNTLLATPSIVNIEQNTIDTFGDETIQIKYFFQDNATTTDYYLMGVINPNKQVPEFGILDDEFSQGQQLFGYYASSETEPGITLLLSVQSMSYGFYDYMNKLVPIASSDSNPFATPTGTLRGNIINQTNTDNFALGYFHLAEIDAVEYLVE
ncbi:DUF4249 family protein [Flavobacterium sp.]|uniref:DUF4249 family protein n=1 Tax=Flavobacterium sp. TaxID=239 RepID=UPI00352793D6